MMTTTVGAKHSLCTLILIVMLCQCANAQHAERSSVYSGNSPCGGYVKSLLGIPASADCERVKWTLTLLREEKTQTPVSFKLKIIYGMQQPSGPGFTGGGEHLEIDGKCSIIKGTATNPEASVLQLDIGKKQLLFVKLDEAILHLLYRDKSLMIGNAGWSYTLSKVRN